MHQGRIQKVRAGGREGVTGCSIRRRSGKPTAGVTVMDKQRISVAQIVISSLILVATLVLIIFGLANYYMERDARLKELRAELRNVSGQLSLSLALPLWNLDYEQVGKIIESAMQNRQVFGVSVRNHDQPRAVAALARDGNWQVVPVDRELSGEGLLSEKVGISYYDKQIGTVEVFVTTRFMLEGLRGVLGKIAFSTVALNICLVTILFFLLSRTVFKPLKAVVGYTLTVSAGGAREASIGEKGFIGELDSLRRGVVKMTGSLLEAQEELVRKEKLSILGQLSGSVGHELRNPLGVMSNAVYFLKTVLTDGNETVKEYLGIMENEIASAQRIITDLLDFARTKPPQKVSVTAGELVRRSLRRCAVPETVTVTVDVPKDLPRLNIDPLQMGQVLENFILNGVQAMPEGGALHVAARRRVQSSEKNIEHRTLNVEPDADFVEISVEDTGEGISPENMKKLFQPLFTTKPRGIGLGLVACRNLVEANGGRIEVESKLGKGTTFSVLLPVASAA